MNDILDGFSSPWRAFHKSRVAEARDAQGLDGAAPGANSWLRQARAVADTTRKRPDQATDH